ncbi:hypothetical protein XM38_031030 [Halomicronema hongdechloris C2206]|uniref:Transposase IS204/IS1001/IS1096/IS1165 DDE domain-containing protein n=1 Tax=Halomicronema hongdechloris C2206 TaxID=1641165 RepID=A0A1Z3HPC2_9CYAN|nr:transposase [Halomicronema hongdechloris]ASC72149.1 hypothetical protein XM38_031030 [Halomicronema hongdechloris C2206]
MTCLALDTWVDKLFCQVRLIQNKCDCPASKWSEALFELLDWMVDAETYFNGSVGTLCRWFGEVLNYFENGTTNGIVEGINNRLKLIKRLGFGFSNFDNFELRCLICWNIDMNLA